MGYKPKTLQNASPWDAKEKPTIVISTSDPWWDECYKNWLQGKTPTKNDEWKKGVFLTTEEI